MNIALIADPYLPVPPRLYGGIERILDFLARGLAARGHRVVLLAHPDSLVPVPLRPYGYPPHVGPLPRLVELAQASGHLLRLLPGLDLIHSFGRLAALLPFLPLRGLPKIQSYQREIHAGPGLRTSLRLARGSLCFTACSSWMYTRTHAPGEWRTIFNGVELDRYEFSAAVAADAPLVFLGRLEAIKGPHHAIAIARGAGRRLLIAGNRVASDQGYFDREIAPWLDGKQVEYVGAVDDHGKNQLLGRAAALLMPIEWEEPFGIVMAEAMACGTPVIGFARGSVPEVIEHGHTGFLCHDVPEAIGLVGALAAIDRAAVRAACERRFSSETILDAYESLYRQRIDSAVCAPPGTTDVPAAGHLPGPAPVG